MASVPQLSTSRKAVRIVLVTLTPPQSETWTLGGVAAAHVEQELANQLAEVGFHGYAAVLLDDGAVAFSLEVC
jgi:hypothetical protein